MIKDMTCVICGKLKPLSEFYKNKGNKHGRQLKCKDCAREISIKYYYDHQEKGKEKSKKYQREHKDEIRKRQGIKSMYENKSCAQYLGVVIAERLCRHLFKDVEVMPHGNTGFDFICNHGKKIDVKSSSAFIRNIKTPRWTFKIKRNKTADFFICVAFDNRTDLNPLHMWMIPGKEINNRGGISISASTVHKWNKWKRDINDAQLCCTEIKSEKRKIKS